MIELRSWRLNRQRISGSTLRSGKQSAGNISGRIVDGRAATPNANAGTCAEIDRREHSVKPAREKKATYATSLPRC
jgi:hypothetical protein